MKAIDSLHVAVHLIVPSGVPIRWPSACRRACSASASAPHFALPSAQPSHAGVLPRTRPADGRRRVRRRAGCSRSSASEGQSGGAKAGHAAPAARTFAAVPRGARGPRCRHVRVLRTTGHARACRRAAMTDRRDDDFRIRPSAPRNRGQGFVSKVLKQAGKASSGKSTVRRPGGSGRAPAPASGPAHAWDAATRRRASPERSSRPCRGA